MAGETLELHPEALHVVGERKNLVGLGYSLGKIGSFSQKWDCDPEGCQRFKSESLRRIWSPKYQPQRLLVLGDLFHSALNEEWNDFRKWLTRIFTAHGLVEFRLVEGNHDVLPDAAFEGLEVQRSAQWSLGPFDFVHDPTDFSLAQAPGRIGIAGHLHPAIRLTGKAKQQLRLPGWWFRSKHQTLVMPNFGTFTGSSTVDVKAGDQFWICTGQSVMPAG